MKKDERSCQNCRYFSGWDGGFFGLEVTTECKHYGNTTNRKNCKKFKRPYPKGFELLNEFRNWFNNQCSVDHKIDYEDLLKFRREWK